MMSIMDLHECHIPIRYIAKTLGKLWCFWNACSIYHAPSKFLQLTTNSHDSKVHEANMGPIWDQQDPGGPYVGLRNFAIWKEYNLISRYIERLFWLLPTVCYNLVYIWNHAVRSLVVNKLQYQMSNDNMMYTSNLSNITCCNKFCNWA